MVTILDSSEEVTMDSNEIFKNTAFISTNKDYPQSLCYIKKGGGLLYNCISDLTATIVIV